MRIQSNLRQPVYDRLASVMANGETEAGFIAAAVEREIVRREKGGKVVVAERKAGRPRNSSNQNGKIMRHFEAVLPVRQPNQLERKQRLVFQATDETAARKYLKSQFTAANAGRATIREIHEPPTVRPKGWKPQPITA